MNDPIAITEAMPPDVQVVFRRARRRLVANSIVVIALFSLVISITSLVFVVDPNPFAIVGALVIVPVCAALAIQQYRGVFRYSARAAAFAGWGLCALSALLLFGLMCTVCEALLSAGSLSVLLREMWIGLIAWAVGGASLLFIGWQDIVWARVLRKAADMGFPFPRPRGFSMRELLAAMTVIAVLIGFTASVVHSSASRSREHVTPADTPFNLPTDATDVSFCRTSSGTTAFEFQCSEAAFRTWWEAGVESPEARAAKVELGEVDGSYEIDRYTCLVRNSTQGSGQELTALIRDGLFYSWSKEDRVLYVAYDRNRGRAYYFSSDR